MARSQSKASLNKVKPSGEKPKRTRRAQRTGQSGPVDEGIGEAGPVDEGIGEAAPVDEGIGEAAPVDEGNGEAPPLDEAIKESAAVHEGNVETPPVDEGNGQPQPIDETIGDAPSVDEAIGQAPSVDEVISEAPPADEGISEAPTIDEGIGQAGEGIGEAQPSDCDDVDPNDYACEHGYECHSGFVGNPTGLHDEFVNEFDHRLSHDQLSHCKLEDCKLLAVKPADEESQYLFVHKPTNLLYLIGSNNSCDDEEEIESIGRADQPPSRLLTTLLSENTIKSPPTSHKRRAIAVTNSLLHSFTSSSADPK